jgi:hypothetical protein
MTTVAEDFDIVGSYNNQRVLPIDAERSVNVFEYIDPLGKKKKSLINTSGLINTALTFPLATGGARGQFVFNNIEYIVFGNNIYEITQLGAVSRIGTLTTSTGYVGIDANTFQIIFVDGQKGYIWDTISNVFVQITDQAFPALPLDVCYLDGFFVVINGNTNQFELSEFNQGLVWGPDFVPVGGSTGNVFLAASGGSPNLILSTGTTLNYQVGTPIEFNGSGSLPVGTPPISKGVIYYIKSVIDATTFTISATDGGAAITFSTTGTPPIFVTNNGQLQQGQVTSHPGTLVACRTLHRRIFFFSQNFTEVWENSGIGTNLPFRRNNSLLIEYGTPAIWSISVSFDMLVFLSQTKDGLGSVMQITGTQPIPISTRALDFQLSQYAGTTITGTNPPQTQVSDCAGFLIKENGLIFYRMNFTAANHTFVYNVTLSDPTTDETKRWHEEETLPGDRHPAQTHAYFNGNNYVGHFSSPILYQLDPETFTNDGENIRRMRITRPIVPPGYQRIRIDRLQVDLLQGQLNQGDEQSEDLFLFTESGLNIDTESGLDILLDQSPLVFVGTNATMFLYLSISKDGGQTYGYKASAPLGNIGQRTFRTLFRKRGTTKRGQAFVCKFEFYDNSPFVVLGASWAYEILPE